MIFFADESVPIAAVRMLEHFDARNEVRALEDHFPKGVSDREWMPEIARWDPKPNVIAGDGRILRNPSEQQVLRDCDLTYFYLSGGLMNLEWDQFAWKLIKVWPDIRRNAERIRAATVFEVAGGSSLKVVRRFATSDLTPHGTKRKR